LLMVVIAHLKFYLSFILLKYFRNQSSLLLWDTFYCKNP
jgi:hypothetical protein